MGDGKYSHMSELAESGFLMNAMSGRENVPPAGPAPAPIVSQRKDAKYASGEQAYRTALRLRRREQRKGQREWVMAVVDYQSGNVPDEYACGSCGVSGVKLWREYNTFSLTESLRCALCASQEEEEDITGIDDGGYHYSSTSGRTSNIGNLVLAIPDEEGTGYWSYTSVPQEGIDWWRRLPTLL